jgi:hypothetical protein
MTAHQPTTRIRTVGPCHPRQIARLRVGVGIWLLLLMTVLYSTGQGGHWAWLLAIGTTLHWVWAYFLFRNARRQETAPRAMS